MVYRSVDLEAVTCKKMLKIEQNQIHLLTLSGDEKTVFRLVGKGLVCDNVCVCVCVLIQAHLFPSRACIIVLDISLLEHANLGK